MKNVSGIIKPMKEQFGTKDIYKDCEVIITKSEVMVPDVVNIIKYSIWVVLINLIGGRYNARLDDDTKDWRWKRLYDHKWRFVPRNKMVGRTMYVNVKKKNGDSVGYMGNFWYSK